MDPDVDVDGFNCVWATWDTSSWSSGEILFSKRDSLGNCIIPETIVSNNISKSWMSRIVIDNSNNVQFIWRDESPQGDGVWHAKLGNEGSVIVSSHLAISGAGGFSSSLYPEVVLNKYNEINIIWDEHPSGYNQMNYTKLDTLGNPIIERIRVSIENITALWPGIGVDSFANNHMAYRTDSGFQDRLTYSKLDNDGNILIDNKFFGTGLLPAIIADHSQNIHMVYEDPAGPGMSIEYLKLDQDGNILIGPEILSVHENNAHPHMAMDSLQYLHVVWDAESAGAFPIMYTKLDTLGDFVISPMQVVYPPYTQGGGMPRIAVDRSNRLHLVWVDQRLNPGVSTDVFYKRGENEPGIEETARLKTASLPKITVFPNPFSKLTHIKFQGPSSKSQVTMSIYDASGRLVKDFSLPTVYSLVPTVVTWDGTDDIGNHLPAGVYFIRLSNFTDAQSIPVVLLKN